MRALIVYGLGMFGLYDVMMIAHVFIFYLIFYQCATAILRGKANYCLVDCVVFVGHVIFLVSLFCSFVFYVVPL